MLKKIFLSLILGGISTSVRAEKITRFVIIVPSYNNEQWVRKNLESIFTQDYPYFRVIYINDASRDRTGQLVQAYIKKNHLEDICTYIENETNQGALYNLYHAIHSCGDEEIVVTLDGDDWFHNSGVLARVALEYQKGNVWLTYGQYTHSKKNEYGRVGCCRPIEEEVIKTNSHRHAPWRASHLRTFYAKLFKLIHHEDLHYQGRFFKVTWDLAMMFPMLEMAQERHRFIPNVLYVYNTENSISDFRIYAQEQIDMDSHIRNNLPSYSRVESLFSLA